MLNRWLQKLENPEIPFLGPIVYNLQFAGLLVTENILLDKFFIFMHVYYYAFCISQLMDLWIVRHELDDFVFNLKMTIPLNLNAWKAISFLYWRSNWKSIIEYVTNADKKQRNTDDEVKKNIIHRYTKYSRKLTYFIGFFMYTTIIVGIAIPSIKYAISFKEIHARNGTDNYLLVARSWAPFETTSFPGDVILVIFQGIAALFSGGYVTAYDTIAVATMVFFHAELQMLKRDSAFIFGAEMQMLKKEDAMERIKDCHKRHLQLLECSRTFNDCFSPIMFLYILVLSVLICVTVYEMTVETSAAKLVMLAEFVLFAIAELFIYCWHSNEVLYMSYDLMEGPYESLWWATDVNMRKNVIILTAQFRESILFTAGPFAELTLPTFIAVIKGAYSYYTLLSQSQSLKK